MKQVELKTIRLKMGLTQRALGIKLKITQAAVSHWERGMSYPSITLATKIAKLAAKKGFNFLPQQLRNE